MPTALVPLYLPSMPVTLVNRRPSGPPLPEPSLPGLEDLEPGLCLPGLVDLALEPELGPGEGSLGDSSSDSLLLLDAGRAVSLQLDLFLPISSVEVFDGGQTSQNNVCCQLHNNCS